MNKDQLATELKQKLKLGIKPSDLKKPQSKSIPKTSSPPPISIDKKPQPSHHTPLSQPSTPTKDAPSIVADKKNINPNPSKNQDDFPKKEKSINPTSPLPTSQLLALQKQIEIQQAIKKADEKQKQELAEKVKVLETKLSETQEKLKTIIQLASQAKTEYEKTIQDLQSQIVSPKEQPKKEPKLYLFTCDICQQNKKSPLHLAKINGLGIDPTKTQKVCAYCIKRVDPIKPKKEEFF